jgi:hypothetical protein
MGNGATSGVVKKIPNLGLDQKMSEMSKQSNSQETPSR